MAAAVVAGWCVGHVCRAAIITAGGGGEIMQRESPDRGTVAVGNVAHAVDVGVRFGGGGARAGPAVAVDSSSDAWGGVRCGGGGGGAAVGGVH
jgi:hypothetical protein